MALEGDADGGGARKVGRIAVRAEFRIEIPSKTVLHVRERSRRPGDDGLLRRGGLPKKGFEIAAVAAGAAFANRLDVNNVVAVELNIDGNRVTIATSEIGAGFGRGETAEF